jgi:SAM-dependent methyltransferase
MRSLVVALLVGVNAQFPTPASDDAFAGSNGRAPLRAWEPGSGFWDLGFEGWDFQTSSSQRHGRLFPPEDLGLLEIPDRRAWQKPEQIMDALNIAEGSAVADVGAGAGWFTIHLARRVGPNGVVYAVDVQAEMVEAIRRRVNRERLGNVRTIRGSGSMPNLLPRNSLDAVLVVDAYQEVDEEERAIFLRNLSAALKPNGRLGIVNHKPGSGGPGPEPEVRVASTAVEDKAREAGLRVVGRENLPYQYMLVLGR